MVSGLYYLISIISISLLSIFLLIGLGVYYSYLVNLIGLGVTILAIILQIYSNKIENASLLLSVALVLSLFVYIFYSQIHGLTSIHNITHFLRQFFLIIGMTGLSLSLFLTLSSDESIVSLRKIIYNQSSGWLSNPLNIIMIISIILLAFSVSLFFIFGSETSEGFSSKIPVNPVTNPSSKILQNPAYVPRRFKDVSMITINNPTLMTSYNGTTWSEPPKLGEKKGQNSITGIQKALGQGIRSMIVPIYQGTAKEIKSDSPWRVGMMTSKGGQLNTVTISLRSVLEEIRNQLPNMVDAQSKDFIVLILRPTHIRGDDNIATQETELAELITNTIGERLSVSRIQGTQNQSELANVRVDDGSVRGKVIVLYGGVPRSDQLGSIVNGVVDFSKIPIVEGDQNDDRLNVPVSQVSGVVSGIASQTTGGLGQSQVKNSGSVQKLMMAFPEKQGTLDGQGTKPSDTMSLPHVEAGAHFVVMDGNVITRTDGNTSISRTLDGQKNFINEKSPSTFILTANTKAQQMGGGTGSDPEFALQSSNEDALSWSGGYGIIPRPGRLQKSNNTQIQLRPNVNKVNTTVRKLT